MAGSNTVAAAFARFDPLRFFSLGLPQSKGLRTSPQTLEALKEAIQQEVAAITP